MNVVRVPRQRPSRITKVETITSSVTRGEIASGFPPIPGIDLKNKGGKTISDLSFANFYVGNIDSWNQSDIQSIDSALKAAMSDKNLNNVMVQYFPGHDTITSTDSDDDQTLLEDDELIHFPDLVDFMVRFMFQEVILSQYIMQ
jgi:hypothetical protein